MDNIGPHGSLNNDNFLRAILAVRNTPDLDCKISPAEILFGRPLRDAFSFVTRLNKFTNPTIRPTWREAWGHKEAAMKARYTRSMESLNEHSRDLPELKVGDLVFIQNQRGSHPTKWDASGVVKELGGHDKYTVNVDGSGRLTTRNRRFLRKYTPPTTNIPRQALPSPTFGNGVPTAVPPPPSQLQEDLQEEHTNSVNHPAALPTVLSAPTEPANLAEPQTPAGPITLEHVVEPVPSTSTSTPVSTLTQVSPPTPVRQEPRASSRTRLPRRHYIPETGTWE